LGDYAAALAAGQQDLAIATALGNPVQRGMASYHLGQAHWGIGDLDKAAELLRASIEALSLDTPGLAKATAIQSRAWLARILSTRGEFDEGRRSGEEALRLAMGEPIWDAPIIAHGCLGALYIEQGH